MAGREPDTDRIGKRATRSAFIFLACSSRMAGPRLGSWFVSNTDAQGPYRSDLWGLRPWTWTNTLTNFGPVGMERRGGPLYDTLGPRRPRHSVMSWNAHRKMSNTWDAKRKTVDSVALPTTHSRRTSSKHTSKVSPLISARARKVLTLAWPAAVPEIGGPRIALSRDSPVAARSGFPGWPRASGPPPEGGRGPHRSGAHPAAEEAPAAGRGPRCAAGLPRGSAIALQVEGAVAAGRRAAGPRAPPRLPHRGGPGAVERLAETRARSSLVGPWRSSLVCRRR